MPTAFKNADYYNLVNNTLLNPELIKKYTRRISSQYLVINKNPELLTFTLSPLEIRPRTDFYYGRPKIEHFVYSKNRADFYSVWERVTGSNNRQLYKNIEIDNYIKNFTNLCSTYHIKLLEKLVKNNTYKIKTMLIKAMCDAYFDKYVAPSVIKAIAINKIKRNKIYNMGLGLKLAVRAYDKDF